MARHFGQCRHERQVRSSGNHDELGIRQSATQLLPSSKGSDSVLVTMQHQSRLRDGYPAMKILAAYMDAMRAGGAHPARNWDKN